MQNKKGFTIFEILIATLIAGISLFGVLRLVNNNVQIGNNIGKKEDFSLIFRNTKECIKSFGFENIKDYVGNSISINFGSDNSLCLTGSYDNNFSFSGININGNEYYSFIEINTGSENYLNIKNTVSDISKKEEFEFKLFR